MSDIAPAVFRNGRYERRLAITEERIIQLAQVLTLHAEAMERLTRAVDSEAQIPALPDLRGRAFGGVN